jgi:hypothetical protein
VAVGTRRGAKIASKPMSRLELLDDADLIHK